MCMVSSALWPITIYVTWYEKIGLMCTYNVSTFLDFKVIAITLCSNIIFNKTFTTIVAHNGEFHAIYYIL